MRHTFMLRISHTLYIYIYISAGRKQPLKHFARTRALSCTLYYRRIYLLFGWSSDEASTATLFSLKLKPWWESLNRVCACMRTENLIRNKKIITFCFAPFKCAGWAFLASRSIACILTIDAIKKKHENLGAFFEVFDVVPTPHTQGVAALIPLDWKDCGNEDTKFIFYEPHLIWMRSARACVHKRTVDFNWRTLNSVEMPSKSFCQFIHSQHNTQMLCFVYVYTNGYAYADLSISFVPYLVAAPFFICWTLRAFHSNPNLLLCSCGTTHIRQCSLSGTCHRIEGTIPI